MVNPCGFSIGHVLICPIRQVSKFTDLTELETLELFVTAKLVMKGLEENVKFKSFQMVILEGPQLNTDQQAHMHIIPMVP